MTKRISIAVRALQPMGANMLYPRPPQGFSMLELMIVLVIIGVGAAAAAPGIISALTDSQAGDAAVDLVRLGRRARSEPLTNGRAHVLRFDGGDNAHGRVRLHRGTNNGCNTQAWNFGADNLLDEVDAAVYNSGGGGHTVRIAIEPDVELCYQPNGAVMIRGAGGGRFGWSHAGVESGVVFTVSHYVGDEKVSVDREVVFPLGGTARLRR